VTTSGWTRRQILGTGAALLLAPIAAACSNGGSDAGSEGSTSKEWGGDLIDPPIDKPDFTLQTTDGEPFSFLEDTRDRLTLIFFGFTNCPDQCPIWLTSVARAKEQIGSGPGSDPLVLFVGVDVARDTPEALETYLARIDPAFVGLTGTEEQIAAANDSLYFPPITIGSPDDSGEYDIGHYGRAAAFSPDNTAHRLYGYDVRSSQLAHDLPLLDTGTYQ
jgi:protein SCO1/2